MIICYAPKTKGLLKYKGGFSMSHMEIICEWDDGNIEGDDGMYCMNFYKGISVWMDEDEIISFIKGITKNITKLQEKFMNEPSRINNHFCQN